ncbi:MAG: DUF4177 domain-containing protein [Clostridia bacterium]|nr:DUF4177 domain-containing protein [Clostridia bacterium]
MKIYKVVPYAGNLVISKDAKVQDAIVNYFDVIKQEAVDGWELLTIAPVNVVRKDGGAALKGENYSALIFAKDAE